MNNRRFIILFLIFISTAVITVSYAQNDTIAFSDSIIEKENTIQKEPFTFTIGKSVINKTLWLQPYRFEDKSLKTLTVKVIIKRNSEINEPIDFNFFTLINESKKLRIRPSGVYYLKRDKKKYLKSKTVNENYNNFKETTVEGFQNFEAKTYKINFLGLKKKKVKPSIKSLKKVTIKAKGANYFIDFPVQEGFTYGKIYYNNKPIGFSAVKNE